MKSPQQLFISVALSTRNRADILQNTLLSMQHQSPGCDWELIVVDNASTDHTPDVLASMSGRLPLRSLREPCPGKSRAINMAMGLTRGALVVFTDDDVKPHSGWLAGYERASEEYPSVNIFCGPISNVFPADAPAWLADCPHAAPLFARFAPLPAEGYMPSDLLPFGGNFAVRSSLLGGTRLDETLGPPNPIMGEDTDFLLRLRSCSPEIVYAPQAGVDHCVRPEQLLPARIFERAFTCGTSMIAVMDSLDIVPCLPETDDPSAMMFNLGADLNYSYGQLYQLSMRGGDPREQTLLDHIAGLNWSGEPALLADRAHSWLLKNSHLVPDSARYRFLADSNVGVLSL